MRPFILSPLFASVEGLLFVGSKTANRLERFGKSRVLDLIWSFPTHCEKRTFYEEVVNAAHKETVCCEVSILQHVPPFKKNHPYRVLCTQAHETLSITFFHASRPHLEQILPVGGKRLVCGVLEKKTTQGFQIIHPHYLGNKEDRFKWEGVSPVYGLTSGISQNIYRKVMGQALQRLPDLPEWLPSDVKKRHRWPSWKEALLRIHKPLGEEDLLPSSPYRERLAFDEFLSYQLGLALFRKDNQKKVGQFFQGTEKLVNKVRNQLPFKLTEDQEDTLRIISSELKSPSAMMRLLQGDVGSGKTIVAILSMLQVVESGGQCAFLVPTEILAEQHYKTLEFFLKGLDITVALFLGRSSKKEKKALYEKLKTGSIRIAIGTHALLESDVSFHRLGLAVIDEQHRFGVEQRQQLINKSEGVNVLVMSATPIPRSLALTLYGDLDISFLKQKPQGRLPIQTKVLPLNRLSDVHEALKRAVIKGQKIYWVCPLIEESEALDLGHTKARVDILTDLLGPEKVAWMHGRMTTEEKEKALDSFKSGLSSVLVSTTVIEVGIDIPEATIIIIEHAERFGLAQLHQLRGRVGRGSKPSTCLLLYGKNLSILGKQRLEVMRSTEDGFFIAEEDLRLRGGGDLLGTKQSGLPDFKISCLETQSYLLEEATVLAGGLVELEETLPENLRVLRSLFQRI